ncbi:DUF1800 domain-containing protein [Ramlibacter sp. PS4R-6]|uniref:DUF1800 domain-containing protein n=1 Tax=Ramlibacter sp. PS4R-6 TaxID=3133438 RepID=UPI003099A9DA
MARWIHMAAAAGAAFLAGCGGGDAVMTLAGQQQQSALVAAAPVSNAAAVRFLEQATFGPTPGEVAHVQSVGFDAWLNEQFAMKPTQFPNASDRTSLEAVQASFFNIAVNAPDQLRQRVAFALGQVMVVSDQKLDNRAAIASYQRVLVTGAFGNYRQLLKDVTLSPAMGTYLDMANNVKEDPEAGTAPNENYAREVLQLFSVGLVKLNSDGTPVLDTGGKPIATYSQETVEGFAHVFTGWTYPSKRRSKFPTLNGPLYTGPLQLVESYHQGGTKQLLDGATVSQGAAAEMEVALDNIAGHPNVGPFIGTRLIQALVKSNPSPAYVQRVAAAFANNGSGQRGDMKAVIRAVLLDAEARAGDTQAAAASDGKLREPVLYMTRLMRAFATRTSGVGLPYYAQSMRQDVFDAPSVFNFYPPSYKPQGYTLYGPEFKLLNSPSVASRLNFAWDFANGGLPNKTLPNFTPLVAAATAGDAALVAQLDATLMHGTMPDGMKSTLATALVSSGAAPRERAMLALYLVAASPAFNIQR